MALRRLAAVLLLVLAALPARAETTEREALLALQRLDARVQSIGWRLAQGNARFCRTRALGVGLQLHDVYNYDDPAGVRRSLGLASDIAVAAVAAGGPAERAGVRANDALGEVAGQPVGRLPRARPGDYARLARLHDGIDAALAAKGSVELAVLRGDRPLRLAIPGEEVCASRFELLTDGGRAAADGTRVIVSRRFVEFLTEDEQLAALLAHELAHNVLQHRLRLNAQGRTWSNIRATEREADRLSVWLLANAGYDPAAAVRFMGTWGPANDHGIFSSPDHDRWRTRLRLIEQELVRLTAARAARGEADWRRDFIPGEGK